MGGEINLYPAGRSTRWWMLGIPPTSDAPAMRRETLTTIGVALRVARTFVRGAFHAFAYLIDDTQAVLKVA